VSAQSRGCVCNFGYTEEDHAQAWGRAFDLYAELFPGQALAHVVMGLNRYTEPAVAVAEQALKKYGSRVRLQTESLNGNAWWRTQPYTWGFSYYNHWLARQAPRTCVGWQMWARSWGKPSPIPGDPEGEKDQGPNGTLETALRNGIAFEGSWIEVWMDDLHHPEYEPILRQAAQDLGVVIVNVP
jgi:hypothetical protein